MTDYQIQPNSRICSVSGRALLPGERFYSALLVDGADLVRKDFGVESWQGPPPAALGFWCGKVPPPQENAKPRIDDDLLEECFHRLEGQADPGKVNFRYVVTLLLVRRKRFQMDLGQSPPGKLFVRCLHTGQEYVIEDPKLDEEEMAQVQDEVFKVLGWS